MLIADITLGVDTAVVGGTGTLLLLAFGQVWARTRSVDGQRDAVTQMAMRFAEDITRQANAERDYWRERWENEFGTERRGHPSPPDATPDRPDTFGGRRTPPAENGDDGTATL